MKIILFSWLVFLITTLEGNRELEQQFSTCYREKQFVKITGKSMNYCEASGASMALALQGFSDISIVRSKKVNNCRIHFTEEGIGKDVSMKCVYCELRSTRTLHRDPDSSAPAPAILKYFLSPKNGRGDAYKLVPLDVTSGDDFYTNQIIWSEYQCLGNTCKKATGTRELKIIDSVRV